MKSFLLPDESAGVCPEIKACAAYADLESHRLLPTLVAMSKDETAAMQAARVIAARVDELEKQLKAADKRDTIFGIGWPLWLFICILVFLVAMFAIDLSDARHDALRQTHVSP